MINPAEMEACRELDEAVAEQVMGWTIIKRSQLSRNHWPWRRPDGEFTYALPAFSVDLYAAWEIVDRMRQFHLSFQAKGWINSQDVEVRFSDWYAANGGNGIVVYAIASSFPLAICRAALKAIETIPTSPRSP
jgi:hypothetical protein